MNQNCFIPNQNCFIPNQNCCKLFEMKQFCFIIELICFWSRCLLQICFIISLDFLECRAGGHKNLTRRNRVQSSLENKGLKFPRMFKVFSQIYEFQIFLLNIKKYTTFLQRNLYMISPLRNKLFLFQSRIQINIKLYLFIEKIMKNWIIWNHVQWDLEYPISIWKCVNTSFNFSWYSS